MRLKNWGLVEGKQKKNWKSDLYFSRLHFVSILWREFVCINLSMKRVFYKKKIKLIAYHLYVVMVNGIRTSYSHGLDKGFNLRFSLGFQVQYKEPEEGQRTYRPKHCQYNNEDVDNTLNILMMKNNF